MFEQAFKKIDDILRKDAGVSSERDYSYDFVHAHEKFNDPEWDGPPLEPEPAPAPRPPQPPAPPSDGEPPMVIRLADGKAREIQHMTARKPASPASRIPTG
jgi:type I restriction enzyme R subunit